MATANYDGTIEIAVNTKPWPTTTCITDPVCTLNVGAGSAPTQNPDCDFILERCEGSDFYFVRYALKMYPLFYTLFTMACESLLLLLSLSLSLLLSYSGLFTFIVG